MRTHGSGSFDPEHGWGFRGMGAPDQDRKDRSDSTSNEDDPNEKSTSVREHEHDSESKDANTNTKTNTKTKTKTKNQTTLRPPPNTQPTNWLSVNYRMPISGTYVVDPSLAMPADLIPDNPTRKANLCLECTRGSIVADVWLVGGNGEMSVQGGGGRLGAVGGGGGGGRRAVIDVLCKSWMGKVDLKLFTLTSRPFSLTVTSNGGDISVALPTDFEGPITLSAGSLYDYFRPSSFTPFSALGPRENVLSLSNSQGTPPGVGNAPYSTSIVFSDMVKTRLVTFSEAGGKRTCFIGDYRSAGYVSRKDWTGSLVDIRSAYGNLRISFVDEKQRDNGGDGCVVM